MEYRPRQHRRRLVAAAVITVAAALCGLSSCASRLGWGLVLWTAPEGKLPAGSVVPVYIKSNINHVYVVGSLDGRSKVELPLWQVELFKSRAQAKAAATKFAAVSSLYLIAARDGLPVREAPTNADDNRVYRLREGETVKVLSKAQGEVVRTGDTPLAGDWYFVLTEDGTRGYVFSNTMRLFDEKVDSGLAPLATSSTTSAVKIDVFFTRQWRPAYFQEMNDSGRPDLDVFNPRFGIFIDAIRRQIRLELPAASQVFSYTSITEDNGSFEFEGSPLRIKFINERRLVADWTGQAFNAPDSGASAFGAASTATNAPAAASQAAKVPQPGTATQGAVPQGSAPQAAAPQGATLPSSAVGSTGMAAGASAAAPTANFSSSMGSTGRAEFVILSFDIRDVIRTEELRRQRLLDAFLAKGSDWSLLLMPQASIAAGAQQVEVAPAASGAAGAPPVEAPGAVAQASASRFQVSGDGRFRWARTDLVPAGYLPLLPPSTDVPTGDIAFRLYLPSALAGWDGIMSIRFDAAPGSDWTDFLWRSDGEDIVLQPAGELPNLDAASPSPLMPLRLTPARNH